MAEHIAFNGDRHIGLALQQLIARFGIRSVIETGTWSGGTTRTLRTMVAGKVTTLDTTTEHLIADHGLGAVADLEAQGIALVLGNSKDTLVGVLAGYGDGDFPVLLYLDAHGEGNPLRSELEAIGNEPRCRDTCVIVLHDCLNPHRELGFNWVDWGLGAGAEPLSYASVADLLPAIYQAGHQVGFNDEAEGCMRGVCYVMPVSVPA